MTLPSSSFPDSRPILCALLLLMLILALSACAQRSGDPISSSQTSEPTASLTQTTQKAANDEQPLSPRTNSAGSNQRININTAPAAELEKLPGIGKGLAERIIDHRERFGPFRRPEHLIIVRGISDKRFRALRDLITVE